MSLTRESTLVEAFEHHVGHAPRSDDYRARLQAVIVWEYVSYGSDPRAKAALQRWGWTAELHAIADVLARRYGPGLLARYGRAPMPQWLANAGGGSGPGGAVDLEEIAARLFGDCRPVAFTPEELSEAARRLGVASDRDGGKNFTPDELAEFARRLGVAP